VAVSDKTQTTFLHSNAYHEGGHAIVGWALGLRIIEITIREDCPGENAKMAGSEKLTLLDQVAVLNAGRVAQETFEHLSPPWASGRDREDTLKLLTANDILDVPELERWITRGRARAREVLVKHERNVHKLAARLIECRRMDAGDFETLMSE
jgi:ATP-dependent Zn protease